MSNVAPAEWDLLLSAAQKNNADRIRDLLAMGVDPNHANAVGQSALHIASLWGHGKYEISKID
jgi:ankyrin repeat protein